MSWAAHELESVILHRHMDRTGRAWRISYLAILIGALMPDFTKLPVLTAEYFHENVEPAAWR